MATRGSIGLVLLFALREYAEAEVEFIYSAIDALSRGRGGIVSLITREPTPRVGTTQVTTDDGKTVEFQALAIATPMKMSWEGIAAGNADELLATLDAAAEHHHEELAKYIFSNLDALTEATGNQIDATGKSFFEYMYEMFDKVELTFEDDGSISPGFAFVGAPRHL